MTSSITSTAASSADAGGGAGATRGARFALIVLALLWPTQLASLIGMLTGNAQAKVALHFHTTQIAWFILSSALVSTMVTPFAVKAADIFGKRQVMIVITGIGLVGDVIAASAPSYAVMLLGRGIAGFYGPIAALAYATIREVLPPKQAATASSIVGSGIAFVAIGGPFLSGWLIDGYGFRGPLWAMAAATAIGLILLTTLVPATKYRDLEAKMDYVGALLLGGGLTAVTFGVSKGTDWGWTSSKTLACIIGGVIAIGAFAVTQTRVSHPMLKLSMLARRPVWSVVVATSLIGGVVFGAAVITQLLVLYPKVVVPYPIPGGHGATVLVHMSDGLGMSATHFAIIGLPATIMILVLGFGTGLAIRKIDSRIPLRLGALLIVVGYLLQSAYHYNGTELVLMGIVYALGFGMIVSVIPVLIIEVVTPEEQAIGNGIQTMAMGVITTLATTVCYVLLAGDGKVLQGTQLYLDQGYKDAYYFAAGLTVVGLLAALLIPKLKRVEEIESGTA